MPKLLRAIALAVPFLAVIIVAAAAVQRTVVDDNSKPTVRVTIDTASRLMVYDLRQLEAPPRTLDPSAVKPPPSSGAPVTRVRVPSVGISAPIVNGKLTADGRAMIAPNSASAVAWYEYSPKPGQGGNAVFSGHVDYINVGPAVFWSLRSATPGDVIEVDLADGSSLRYRVEFNKVYSARNGPWDDLFSPTADNDVITLYTCDGAFSAGEYADRRVVRASRIF